MTLIYLETKKYLTTEHPNEKEHKKNHYTKEPYTNTNTKEQQLHVKEQELYTKEPNNQNHI